MKQAKWPTIAKQWLLVATLITPLAGIAEQADITVDVVIPEGRFVIFYITNFEDKDFQCAYIRVQATVKDRHGHIVARRSIIARNVALPAGALESQVEAGKRMIKVLENQFEQPRIVEVSDPKYRCKPKPEAAKPETESGSMTPDKKVFRDRLKDGSLGPEMVWIPAGRFRMGDIQGGGRSNEQPVHEVSVARFAIGLYEITFSEYDLFAAATGRAKPSDHWGRGNRPVINVSWNDVTAYAEWLSQQTGHQYRLPTEAQWEYAARAGTETARYWGNNPDEACDYANVGDQTLKAEKPNWSWVDHKCTDGYVYTAPVGRFKPNGFGLFDMLGNVWEWTCSEYEDRYSGQEQVCSSNEGGLFVLRGGSWNFGTRGARTASRLGRSRSVRFRYYGARLARIK